MIYIQLYIYIYCMCVCILNDPKANAVILPQLQCRIHAIHCENYLRWCGIRVKENQVPNMSPKVTTFFFVEHLEAVSKIECFLLIETLPPQ